ncbi:ABC-type multidrug transport system, ATPase component [Actinokineospora spheciospongiae]|uniref:ABC-type multidrug transport system, ATPase component n=1 Tax=Actinokineospora spheciospongiae TaxID=909613 RepID=W7IYG0_9PSEU|nr:ATP-binding cassette domain-containing protein [Actinokineospora spheciospongiae]EWC61531.1 ABC-type multidrug transport system, ATPase component [Actinokineospora spheciospongiae]
MIEGRGLGVRFGERWLFRGLDLDVPGGTCVVLTGDNGSGKSTLLRCLYGAQELTEGTVTVNGGAPDERHADFRRGVSVLFDDSTLFDALTPRQHLDLVGVDVDPDLPDDPAYTLSSGQRRRLLLLGAIHREHRVLLLDEPERALDAGRRRWLAGLVDGAKGRGSAVVIASHDPLLAGLVADHVVDLG